jgi:hypothetical protein
MDRFATNTFRTLGLIVVSIVVIGIAIFLALLGLCFTILASADHHQPQNNSYLFLGIAAALIFLIGGICVVGAMGRAIFRDSKNQGQPPVPPYSLIPPSSQPSSTAPTSQTNFPQPIASPPPALQPSIAQFRRSDAATHLSPASRTAVDRLILAIAAQASSQLIVGIIEWLWAAQISMPRFRLHGPLLLAWNLAAVAPYILLVIALRRRPGQTAFSFCLVIPGLRSFLGLFGQTASIIVFLSTFHSGMPLLSIIPWALDCLIFYLAWKAVRLTGIEPSPQRLILSAIDIFLYSVSLSFVFVLLTVFSR